MVLTVANGQKLDHWETWEKSDVPKEHQIQGMGPIEITVRRLEKMAATLQEIFGYTEVSQKENISEDDKKSWEDKHNFYNSFSSVDPTQYDHESDYLDDLRVKWKEYYDPSDMYDVDPHDYDNEGDYMDAIQNFIKMKMR